MAKLTTIYWRDIPAAMRAGKGSSHAYLEEWRRESRPCDGVIEEAVKAEVERLEAQFPDDVLEVAVKASGIVKKDQ